MQSVLILGAGKIGSLITCLLAQTNDYQILVGDLNFSGSDIQRVKEQFPDIVTLSFDVRDKAQFAKIIDAHQINAVISCLPYFCNSDVATFAREFHLHYFDLTEDTAVTSHVKKIASDTNNIFVPQCGLAPGFISIVANHLMQQFDKLDAVNLRVGALPQYANNGLQYSLTWSTDGLINEYGNPCHAIRRGKLIELTALENLEKVVIDGCTYEAFNTSGGLGTLAESYRDRINQLDYKTIRYPGHCEQIKLLMNDLKLNDNRETLKQILENAVAKTAQDVVIVFVSAKGWVKNEYLEKFYVNKIYPRVIADLPWSAIQVSTAASACAVFDIVMQDPKNFHGLVLQEQINLEMFLANRFGRYYDKE